MEDPAREASPSAEGSGLLNLTLQELGTLKRDRRQYQSEYISGIIRRRSNRSRGYTAASGEQGFVNFAPDTRARARVYECVLRPGANVRAAELPEPNSR